MARNTKELVSHLRKYQNISRGTRDAAADVIEKMDHCLWKGVPLANIAFNLSQDTRLTPEERELLRNAYLEWDIGLRGL